MPGAEPDFATADLSNFPSLNALEEDEHKCLWVLWVSKASLNHPWLTPAQVSDALRDTFGTAVSRQKAEAILSRAKDAGQVVRRVAGGRRRYQVMDSGIAAVRTVQTSILFITPDQSLTSVRRVEELLASLRGDLRVCDPYVDNRTLDWLSNCTQATSIKLLSANVKNRATTFQRDLAAFRRQFTSVMIDVGVIPAGVLHDRYVIDDSNLLLFGTSLNNLGAKQTFVVIAGPDLRATVIAAFDTAWAAANPA